MLSGARLVAGAAAARAAARVRAARAFAVGRGLLLTRRAADDLRRAVRRRRPRRSRRSPATSCPTRSRSTTCRCGCFVLGVVVSLAGGLAQAAAIADTPARGPLLRLGRGEWLLALGALNALFALFVAVQLAVLFGGDAYVRDSAGLTYARVRALGLRAARRRRGAHAGGRGGRAALGADRERAARQRILRALLCALCLLTLVVLASALHRLGLYEQAYGFTRTRLAVHALLLFGGALFVLVIAALASDRREWLAQATVLLAAVAALAFWVGDPDRRIAAHNVERYEATGRIDTGYLARLSADAVPALMRAAGAAARARGRAPARAAGRASADGLAGRERRARHAPASVARASPALSRSAVRRRIVPWPAGPDGSGSGRRAGGGRRRLRRPSGGRGGRGAPLEADRAVADGARRGRAPAPDAGAGGGRRLGRAVGWSRGRRVRGSSGMYLPLGCCVAAGFHVQDGGTSRGAE